MFVCAACDQLAFASRSNAITCSPACRVQAQRKGTIRKLTELASGLTSHRSVALMLREMALVRLFGEEADKMVQRRESKTVLQARARWQREAFQELMVTRGARQGARQRSVRRL